MLSFPGLSTAFILLTLHCSSYSQKLFLFNRGAYKLEDIISSASPEYIQEVQRLQTLIQPDDESTVQLSSVRIITQYTLQTH
jgi:hypothetical protein